MMILGEDHPYIDAIMERPVYKLTGYVYKKGTEVNEEYFDGVDADFELAEDDFFPSGNVIRADNSGSIPIGNTVSTTCTLNLKLNDNYELNDFDGAWIGLVIRAVNCAGDDTPWNVTSYLFYVTSAEKQGEKLVVECADSTFKLNKAYQCGIEYSADTTLWDVFKDAVLQCGLTCYAEQPTLYPSTDTMRSASDYFFNNFSVSEEHINYLKSGEYTCAQVCGYVAFMVVGNVSIEGVMVDINPSCYYIPADGTKFFQHGHHLTEWITHSESGKVNLTGIQYTVTRDDNGNELDPVTYYSTEFTDEYAIDISDNPFVYGIPDAIENALDNYSDLLCHSAVFPLHKLSAEHIAYPLLRYGDFVKATLNDGEIETHITGFEWNINGSTTISCDLPSEADKNADYGGSTNSSSTSSGQSEAVDSIVEQGTSGKWTYQVWKSGLKECWATFATDVVAVSQWGSSGIYYGTWMDDTANQSGRAYPVEFAEIPVCMASPAAGNNDFFLILSTSNRGGTALTHAPAFYVARPSNAAIVAPKISYYVRGN